MQKCIRRHSILKEQLNATTAKYQGQQFRFVNSIICKLSSHQVSFLIANYSPTGKNLAINKEMCYVNECCPLVRLIYLYAYRLLCQGPPSVFIVIHWMDRSQNRKKIRYLYRVYKIIDNALK